MLVERKTLRAQVAVELGGLTPMAVASNVLNGKDRCALRLITDCGREVLPWTDRPAQNYPTSGR